MNFNSAVTIYGVDDRNAYGEKGWTAGVVSKARVVQESVEVLDKRGERTNSDLTIHLPLEEYDIEIGQKIEYDDRDYLVLKVSKPKNEVGHYRDVKLICKLYGES